MKVQRNFLPWVAGLVVLALAGLWWHYNMVRAPIAIPNVDSPASEEPRLAAARLLERFGHPVNQVKILRFPDVRNLPKGVLLMPAYSQADPTLGGRLLEWVRQGNTVIYLPSPTGTVEWTRDRYWIRQLGEDALANHFKVSMVFCHERPPECPTPPKARRKPANDKAAAADEEDDEDGGIMEDGTEDGGDIATGDDASDQDSGTQSHETGAADPPSGEQRKQDASPGAPHAPARSAPASKPDGGNISKANQQTTVVPPGRTRPLVLENAHTALLTGRNGPAPAWTDATGQVLRVYREQRGQVVFVSNEIFRNDLLAQQDHAELLLVLASLSDPKATVTIARHTERTTWWAWLWQEFLALMLALTALLLCWLWGASRRFGPLLPAPPSERRALIEHVDASGRWLWKLAPGRERLLQAFRQRTLVQLQRRQPALMRLAATDRDAALSNQTGLPAARIGDALEGGAADTAVEFIRQISTLQQLRAHHERAHAKRHHSPRQP